MPEPVPAPDDHEEPDPSGADDDASAPAVAARPTTPVISPDLARVAEHVSRTLKPLQGVSWQGGAQGSAINNLARQIAKQGVAFHVPRMQGIRQPLYDTRQLAELLRPTTKVGRQIELINFSVKPAIESLAKTLTASWTHHERLFEQTRRAAQALVQSYREALPTNWQALDSDGLDRAISLATETGLCLVWAPREEVVSELVGGEDHDARSLILVDRRVAVLDDLDAVLSDSSDFINVAHEHGRDLAAKAIAASRDGHHEAAQSLTAAALGLLLHEVLGFAQLGAAYKELCTRDVEETVMRLLRITVIELATARALTNTDKHEVGFNRHGTLHGKPEFFSPADCLSALLLLGGWVRELAWWQRHHPETITRS